MKVRLFHLSSVHAPHTATLNQGLAVVMWPRGRMSKCCTTYVSPVLTARESVVPALERWLDSPGSDVGAEKYNMISLGIPFMMTSRSSETINDVPERCEIAIVIL